MGDSLETIDPSIDQQQNVSVVDYKAFCNYLRKAILVLFDEELNSSKLEEALDENRSNQECIKKFLSDPQVPTLYIQKSSTKGKQWNFAIFVTFNPRWRFWWVTKRKNYWLGGGAWVINNFKPDCCLQQGLVVHGHIECCLKVKTWKVWSDSSTSNIFTISSLTSCTWHWIS